MATAIKTFRFADMQVKADGTAGTLEGYGSSFGGDPDSYGDVIAKGAFSASLRQRMPKMLYQHDSAMIAGVWDTAEEDNHGLFLKGRFINTPLSQQAREECAAGALDSMSIGFSTNDQDYDPKTGIRTLKDINLYEVSLVTFPANQNALIGAVKSMPTTIREFEELLRDAGFTSAAVTKIAARGFKARDEARDEPDLTPLYDKLISFTNSIKGN